MDVAPTVLYECGAPVPDDMDGRVLTEIFYDEYIKSNPPKLTGSGDTKSLEYAYSDAEKWSVEKRLQDLGYLG